MFSTIADIRDRLTTISVDIVLRGEAQLEVVQDRGFVEVAEGGEVVLALQHLGVAQGGQVGGARDLQVANLGKTYSNLVQLI